MRTLDHLLNFSNKYDPEFFRKKIAELPSLYSDMKKIISISANLSSSKQALSLIYVSLYFQYWETDQLIRAIGQKAYSQNYNGEWGTVQSFLETDLQTPEEFERKYIDLKGPHDFYGNFLPKAVKTVKLLKVTDLQKKNKKKVRYPQFHRGYKDKGSLRLPSQNHGDRPYKEKLDRRNQISHPLLEEKILAVEDGALGTHPRERREKKE